jgi:CRISPR-associated protein Csb1
MTTFDLPDAPRLLLSAVLTPVQGSRFQPTGFPDVGPGVYTLPNGDEHLLVESAQSVANRLESACWDESAADLVAPLQGLPYVRVNDVEGRLLTTSVLEAHRLNSAYIENSDFKPKLESAIDFDEKRPFDRRKLVDALAKFDIGCLVHGVFLESIAGVLRVPRALSGFIEASGVNRVSTGGVKNDRVQAKKDEESNLTAAEGFGNVPFHRTEFVAKEITAYFSLDLEQIRSYRLSDATNRVLFALSVFKVRRFLETGLRLRTACDLEAGDLQVKKPSGFRIPTLAETSDALPRLIEAARESFASPPVTVAVFNKPSKKK